MNFLDPCPLDKWSPARKSTCLDYWMGHLASPGRLWWQKNCKLSTFSFSLLLVISIKLLLPYCAFFWPGCFLVWKPLLIAISVLLFGYCPMSFNLLYYIIWWSHPSVTTVLRICTLNLNFKMLIKRLGLIVNSVSILIWKYGTARTMSGHRKQDISNTFEKRLKASLHNQQFLFKELQPILTHITFTFHTQNYYV